jgi:tetratricopeptide (TPR) repeat protein
VATKSLHGLPSLGHCSKKSAIGCSGGIEERGQGVGTDGRATVINPAASLSLQPRVPDPRQAFEQAAAAHVQGRLREAEQLYEFVIGVDARHFDAVYRLGLVRLQVGRLAEAEPLFRRAVKLDKRSADAYHHLAMVLTGLGRVEDAIPGYEKALSLRPRYPEAHNNLGHALQMLGRHAEAARHYRKALALNPAYAEACNNLGNALVARGRNEEAIAQYRQSLAINPGYPEAHNNLAAALMALDRHGEAVAHCEQALALRPHYLEARLNLANTLVSLDRLEEATGHYEKIVAMDQGHAEAHERLGRALHMLGRTQEAIPHFERALALNPKFFDAYNGLSTALEAAGRPQEAVETLEKAIAVEPRRTVSYWNLATIIRLGPDDPRFATMRELARDIKSLDSQDQIYLRFALGKIFAGQGDCQQSFQHLLEGNRLKRQQLVYDEASILSRFGRIQAVFTADLLRQKQGPGDSSGVPIFIVGMPRSGTTLIEQILATHPKVFGAGELRHFASLALSVRGADGTQFPEYTPALSPGQLGDLGRDYLHLIRREAPAAERITDKMPYNFECVGLIHLALPNARIIHTRRDPRDIALSCFSIPFGEGHEFTYDLGELGRYIRAYEALMEHWRQVLPEGAMLEVQYEEVVEHLEEEARRIVAYCGLDWNDACLGFHKTQRVVRTASHNQVRQPIYKSSVGRWRAYEAELQPLLRELDRTGPAGPRASKTRESPYLVASIQQSRMLP